MKTLDNFKKYEDILDENILINGHTLYVNGGSKQTGYGSGKKTVYDVVLDGMTIPNMDIHSLKTRLKVAGGGKPKENGRTKEKIRIALKVLKWCAEHPEQAVKTYNLHLQCTANKTIKEKIESERTRLKASGYSENTINIFIAEFEENLRKNNDTQQL